MIEYNPQMKYILKNETKKKDQVTLRGLSPDDLNDLLKAIYKHQHELRFQQKLAEDVSPHMWKKMKKEIAKIKTALKEWQCM